jgi:pimeloyl-ACP methyl ester carboxylesterase
MLSHADLALLAMRSYVGPQSVIVAGDVRACLLPRPGELIVAVPGTHLEDIGDWMRDLDILAAEFLLLGRCHSGFASGAQALREKIAPELPTDLPITYVGHSLGGAIAQGLAAYHAGAWPARPSRLVTFGAPRLAAIGNSVFAALLAQSPHFEYERAGDPVPALPTFGFLSAPTPTPIGEWVSRIDLIANHAIQLYAADLTAAGL